MAKLLTRKQFIKRARKVHGNKYSYSSVNYSNARNKIDLICKLHGIFNQKPDSHLQGQGCPDCGKIQRAKSKIKTKKEFIQESNLIHNNKYDYSKVEYKNCKQKIIITCPKHGDFEQTPDSHIQGQGCRLCANNKISLSKQYNTEQFIEKAKKVHGDKYDYSKVEYKNNTTKVIIICSKHNEFEQTPDIHLQGSNCPICKTSKGELVIKEILDKHNIEYIQEYKILEVLENYRYDFYLPNFRILIEFHGIQHYEAIPFFGGEDALSYTKRRDEIKKYLANRYKYRLLEFNYKQLKHMTQEEFEYLIINKINNLTKK